MLKWALSTWRRANVAPASEQTTMLSSRAEQMVGFNINTDSKRQSVANLLPGSMQTSSLVPCLTGLLLSIQFFLSPFPSLPFPSVSSFSLFRREWRYCPLLSAILTEIGIRKRRSGADGTAQMYRCSRYKWISYLREFRALMARCIAMANNPCQISLEIFQIVTSQRYWYRTFVPMLLCFRIFLLPPMLDNICYCEC